MCGIEIRAGLGVGHLFGDRGTVRLRGCITVGLALVALQQRVALQLRIDERLDLKIRHLQQLDRLLQLGGDDQPLSLPNLQSCAERQLPVPWTRY